MSLKIKLVLSVYNLLINNLKSHLINLNTLNNIDNNLVYLL